MKVRLRSQILTEITSELGFGRRSFQQEEGGYLAGRFDGEAVEIVNYWRDLNAERSAGSIRLREAHLDYVTECIGQSGDPTLYIVGTWHIHPPNYGAQCSSIDREYLFLEHTALRAGGLAQAHLPQTHLILGWNDPYNYRVYSLKVDIPGLNRTAAEPQREHLRAIEEALQHGLGAGILVRDRRVRAEPYLGPHISDAVAAGTLEGFFWLFPYRTIHEEVEDIYLANFVHHVRQGAQLVGAANSKNKGHVIYYRLTDPGGQLVVAPQHLQFPLQGRAPHASHQTCQVTEEITVLLSNPDTPSVPSLNLGAQSQTSVGDIGRALGRFHRLESPPLLSARCPLTEAAKWNQRTVMDEFGEVLLPDDVNITELVDDQPGGVVQLYWRTPDLHPDMIYNLRTQRLQNLGYDQERLAQSTVLIAGLGLLGSEVAMLLMAAGIGRLVLVDRGTVDFPNIYRQRLYNRKDVYQLKVDVATRLLSEAGSKVEGHHLSIPTLSDNLKDCRETLVSLDDLIARADLVIGTLDSFSGRAVLQALCLQRKVPFLSVALDLLGPLGLAQANLFVSLPGRPGCYACGSQLAPDKDQGVCTIAPLEFPPIAGAVAFRLTMDVLHNRLDTACAIQIYSNLGIEEQNIAEADPDCDICGRVALRGKSQVELYQSIQSWLDGK